MNEHPSPKDQTVSIRFMRALSSKEINSQVYDFISLPLGVGIWLLIRVGLLYSQCGLYFDYLDYQNEDLKPTDIVIYDAIFTMTCWAIAIIFCKLVLIVVFIKEISSKEPWEVLPGRVNPDEAKEISQIMINKPKKKKKPSIVQQRIARALQLYSLGQNTGEIQGYFQQKAESDRLYVDSTYTTLRILIWAIPILGFIGTVLGISGAINNLHTSSANTLNITGVTAPLATAFNTTFCALAASIIIMFPTGWVQKKEEQVLARFHQLLFDQITWRLRKGTSGSGSQAPGITANSTPARELPQLSNTREMGKAIGQELNLALKEAVEKLTQGNYPYNLSMKDLQAQPHSQLASHVEDIKVSTAKFQEGCRDVIEELCSSHRTLLEQMTKEQVYHTESVQQCISELALSSLKLTQSIHRHSELIKDQQEEMKKLLVASKQSIKETFKDIHMESSKNLMETSESIKHTGMEFQENLKALLESISDTETKAIPTSFKVTKTETSPPHSSGSEKKTAPARIKTEQKPKNKFHSKTILLPRIDDQSKNC